MFCETVKALRLSNHLTQKELAQALYISPGAISQYEKGKSMPSRETLDRLAKYFSVSVDYLLGISANAEIEALMNQDYCDGMKVAELIRLCMQVSPQDRSALLTVAAALAQRHERK